ncbi:MAG: hypothetical protein F2825_03190 [Actinobacteria bacterium]|nr:hypothetical protein [Actinomycetota bacterium]
MSQCFFVCLLVYLLSDVLKKTNDNYSFDIFRYNTTDIHALPAYFNKVDEILLSISISVISEPYEVSAANLKFDSNVFNLILLIGIGLSVIPAGYAVDIVKDKHLRMKQMLFISGVPASAYYAGFLVCNLAMMSLPFILMFILLYTSHVTPLLGPAFPAVLLTVLLYMPLSTLTSYIAGSLFDNPDTCQQTWPFIQNMLAFVPFIVVGIIDGSGLPRTALMIHYVFCAVDPPYFLLGALYYIYRVYLVAQDGSEELKPADYFHSDTHLTPTFFIGGVLLLVLFSVLVLLEYIRSLPSCLRKKLSVFPVGSAVDEDVIRAAAKAAERNDDTPAAIQVRQFSFLFLFFYKKKINKVRREGRGNPSLAPHY